MSTEEIMIPKDFKVAIPEHTADLGRWMRQNGCSEAIIEIIIENQVGGKDFRTLTDRDLKDLVPVFKLRKNLREWVQSLISGGRKLIPWTESNDLSYGSDKDSSLDDSVNPITADDESTDVEDSFNGHNSDNELQMLHIPGPSSIGSSSTGASSEVVGHSVSRKQAAKGTFSSSGRPKKLPRLSLTEKDDLRMAANEVPTNDLGSLFKNLKLIVPQEIKKCLADQGDISTKGRNEMIKNSLVILKALIDRDQPSAAEFEICAQKIIELVPQMKDPEPPLRKDVFKPWNGVLMQLKKAYYNRKPVERPRKKQGATNETSSNQEAHIEQLKKEMKAKKPDLKKIKPLMLASFQKRREWVEGLKGKGSVKKIFEEFPGFKNYEQLMIEMEAIVKTDQYQQAWSTIMPKLCVYTFNAQEPDQALEEADFDSLDEDEKTSLVIQALPSAWQSGDHLLHFIKPSQELNRFLKTLSADGQLVAIDNDASDGSGQVFVVVDHEVFIEVSSFRSALFALVAVHHVCNIEYPKNLKLCFKFLEEYVFGITQVKKPMIYRKGVMKLVG